MELIFTENEDVNKAVLQIEEYLKNNGIPVTTKALNDTKSVRNLDLDEGAGKPWIVIVMDNVLVELMEGCGRTVSKLLKLTSKPNKIIYYVLIEKERMEMFEADFCNMVMTVDELNGIMNKKTPAEYDEISNTCATLQSLNLESFGSISNNTSKEEQKCKDSDNVKTCQRNKSQQPENGNQGSVTGVSTGNLYPSLLTSYVGAGVSHNVFEPPHRTSYQSIEGNSCDSSGPPAMPCQSGMGYNCNSMPNIYHDRSYQQWNPLHPLSVTGSETGKPMTMNNFSYRPEILDINRNFSPPFNPNILTDGSDNRLSCDRCGHSVIPKSNQTLPSDIGPSSATFNSAGGASGITEKENMSVHPDSKVFVWDLKEDVMAMIRDGLDCAETYNWKKLADIHKWSFGDIYRLEQKWKSRKIDSPFMHLIEGFQHYTLYDLKMDLSKIPRKDLLHKVNELHCKGMLFHS